MLNALLWFSRPLRHHSHSLPNSQGLVSLSSYILLLPSERLCTISMEGIKTEDDLHATASSSGDPSKEGRLREIRNTFHPSFIPSIIVADERGPSEVTFHLINEDHTLCNPLREVLNHHPAVLHVGYTIPHPSDKKVAFMLKVKEGYTCHEVMRDGFHLLMEIFDSMEKKFSEAVIKYKTDNGIPLDEDDTTS